MIGLSLAYHQIPRRVLRCLVKGGFIPRFQLLEEVLVAIETGLERNLGLRQKLKNRIQEMQRLERLPAIVLAR